MSVTEVRNDQQPFTQPLGWTGPLEIIPLFLSTLSCADLLAFEAVAKNYGLYTQKRWKELRIEEFFHFEWPHSCTEKAHYVQGKVLFSYVRGSLPIFKQKDLSFQKLYECLEGVMLCYKTTLGAFIWEEISSDEYMVHSLHEDEFKFPHPRPTTAVGTAGELLIRGLSFQKKRFRPTKYNEIFENAIAQGATCAGLLALHNVKMGDYEQVKSLLLLSARYHDYRGVESLLSEKPSRIKKYYQTDRKFPPVLRRYAEYLSEKHNYVKADKIWDETVISYGDQIPPTVLFEAAAVKYLLGKYGEAEIYFDKGIRSCVAQNLPVSYSVYVDASITKNMLNKFDEAAVLARKAEGAYDFSEMDMECD